MSREEDEAAAAQAREDEKAAKRGALLGLAALLGPGVLGVLVFTLSDDELGLALMIGSGAFGLGAFFGFLFGIPKALTTPRPVEVGPGGVRLDHEPNTNLERISDWLTTILIGAGLVQLTALVRGVGELAESLGASFGGGSAGRTFALGLIVAFLFGGFLASYLFTRIWLQRWIATSDRGILAKFVGKVAAETVERHTSADGRAMELAVQQLEDRDAPPAEEALREAVRAASRGMRAQIYYTARRARRSAFRRRDTAAVARTIPAFQALIASDPDKRYFLNWAQLGTALKECDPPRDAEAIAALDTAIEIRDKQGQQEGNELLEWTRAVTRIRLQRAGTADANASDAILADLRIAVRDPVAQKMLVESKDRDVVEWLRRNALTPDDVLTPPA